MNHEALVATLVDRSRIERELGQGRMNFPGMPSFGRGAVGYRVQEGKIARVYFLM